MAEGAISAGDVLARLQLDVSQYLQGLQQATQATQQFQQRMGQQFQQLPTPGLNPQAWQASLNQAGQQFQHFTTQQQQQVQRLQGYFTGLTGTLGQVVPGLGAVGQAVGSMGQHFQQLTTATAASSVGMTAWVGAAAGIAGAAAAAAVGVISLTRSMGAYALELEKMHAATGISLRDLQTLQNVAATTGEGPESVGQLTRVLQRRLAEAQADPTSQAAFLAQQLYGARTGAVLQQARDPQQMLEVLAATAQGIGRIREQSVSAGDAFATFFYGRAFQSVALLNAELAKGRASVEAVGASVHAAWDDAQITRMAQFARHLNAIEAAAKLLVLVDLPNWVLKWTDAFRGLPGITRDVERLTAAFEALRGLFGGGGATPRAVPIPGAVPTGGAAGGIPAVVPAEQQRLFTQAAERYNVPLPLLLQLAGRESGFMPQAVSPRGARGIMQIMPSTATAWGTNPEALSRPSVNIPLGTQILRDELEAFREYGEEGPRLAVASYNAGRTRVEQAIAQARQQRRPITFANVAPFLPQETQAYVRDIFQGREGLPYPGGLTPTLAGAAGAPAAPTGAAQDPLAQAELERRSLEELVSLRRQALSQVLQLRVAETERRAGAITGAERQAELEQARIDEDRRFEETRRQRPPAEQPALYREEITRLNHEAITLRETLATLEQEPGMRELRGQTALFGQSVQTAEQRLRLLQQTLQRLLQEPQRFGPQIEIVEEAVRRQEEVVTRHQLGVQLGAQAALEAREVRLATIRQEVAQVEGRPQTQLEEQARIVQEQARRAQSRAEALTTMLTGAGLTREQQGRLEEVVGGVAGGLMGAAPGAETLRQIGAVPLDRMSDAVRVLQDLREGTLDLTQALEALQQLHVFDEDSLHRLERMRDVEVDRAQRLEREARIYQERAQITRAQEALAGQVAERREQLATMGGTLEQQRQAALVNAQVRALTQQGIRPELIQEALPGLRQTAVEIDNLGTALIDAQRPLQQFAETYESTFVKIQETTLQALQKTESALVDFFSTGRFNAAQLFQGIVRDFNQLAVHTLITRPLAGLADQLFQGLRGDAPALAGLSAVAGGGTPFARGGLVTRPTMALIGEAGPELVLPLRAMQEGGVVGEDVATDAEAQAAVQAIRTRLARRQALRGLGGAVGAGAGGALGALLLAPPDLQKAQAIYAERFRAWTDQATGDVYVGSVDASKTITWASKVPGAVGYVAEAQEEGAGRQAGRALLSLVGSLAGAYAGGRLGRAQQGAVLRGPTMLLAGEAGPEAVIPLRHGGIPVALDAAGRPGARLPSGATIPLMPMPRLADGGVIGGSALPPTWSGAATSPAAWRTTSPALQLTMNVNGVQDTQGFRATQSQIMRGAALAFQREWTRNL